MKNWILKRLGAYDTARAVIATGLVLSLVTGFLDIAINISSRPLGLSSFSSLLPPLVAMVVFFLLVYLVLWFLIVSHLGSFFKLESILLAISFGLFLGTIITLSSLNGQIGYSLSPTDLFKLSLMVLSSLLISIGSYFTVKGCIPIPRYRNAALVFVLAMPFVLAETAVLMWFHVYRIESFSYIPSFFAWTGYILIVLLTVVLSHHLVEKIKVIRLVAVFIALVILSPLTVLLTKKDYKASSDVANNRFKHVILLTVDTLRADVLSCYDSQNVSTPNVDRLARDGILFTNTISPAPWTVPSVGSIMTGLSPLVHKATKINSQLPDSVSTLAERMRDAGYYTAAIVSNGFLGPHSNMSQGFHEYNFFPRYSIGNSWGVKLVEWLLPEQFGLDVSTSDITKLATEWLESNHDKNFFLWIHYYDPHIPYSPPPGFLPKGEPPPNIGTSFSKPWEIRGGNFAPSLVERNWIRDLYYGEVRYVDENIGLLLDSLKKLGLYNESLIIFTSDHGEEFWEHGGYEHGHSLYNEVLRVPLIIKLPQSAETEVSEKMKKIWETSSSKKISAAVSTQSIAPTVLDICRIEYESDNLSSGSLSPFWKNNPNAFDEKPIISTGLLYYEDRESVIFDDLKYIRSFVTNHEELYDLARDPKERISIVNLFPDKVRMARNILRENDKTARKLGEINRIVGEKEVNFDEETKNKLKSLGYVQ